MKLIIAVAVLVFVSCGGGETEETDDESEYFTDLFEPVEPV